MRHRSSVFTAFFAVALTQPLAAQSIADRYRGDANRFIDAALKDSTAWNRLG